MFRALFGVVHDFVGRAAGTRGARHRHGVDFNTIVFEKQFGRRAETSAVFVPMTVRHQPGRQVGHGSQSAGTLRFGQGAIAVFENRRHCLGQLAPLPGVLHLAECCGEKRLIESAPDTRGKFHRHLLRQSIGRDRRGMRIHFPWSGLGHHEVRRVK